MATERKPTASAVTEPDEPMTYEEFLALGEEERRVEWVDGRVVDMGTVSFVHARLAAFLHFLLHHYQLQRRLGGVLLFEPFSMKTGPDLPGRCPDLLYVAESSMDRLRGNHLDGPADLVVEIVSPDSVQRDREEKHREYEQGGVREYWVLDPDRQQAAFYVLGDDDRYLQVAVDQDGVYRSTVMEGLWLEVQWLWDLPDELGVLDAWGLR